MFCERPVLFVSTEEHGIPMGTVLDNIDLAKRHVFAEMWEALELARLDWLTRSGSRSLLAFLKYTTLRLPIGSLAPFSFSTKRCARRWW